jgi:hypothetical protein
METAAACHKHDRGAIEEELEVVKAALLWEKSSVACAAYRNLSFLWEAQEQEE